MRVLCFVFLLNGFAFGNDLLDKLYSELSEKGETGFSYFEIALIAEGIDDAATLKEKADAWAAFVAENSITEKQQRAPGKRRFSAIRKKLTKVLKTPVDTEDGFVKLMDEGIYNRLTVTWLFVEMGNAVDLEAKYYQPMMDKPLDPYFFTGEPKIEDLAAAYLAYQAYHLPVERAEDIRKMLLASNYIKEGHSYEQETLGKLLYNKMLETHNKANELEKTDLDAAAQGQVRAARIGAGASPCYPKLDIYHAVNFNIGVKLITSNLEQSNRDLVTQLCKELADYTGEYKTDFLRNMGVRDYNYAAKLFNAEKYEEARAVLEAIPAPPDEEEYNRVLANTYTLIIDKIWENNKDEESETERAANKTKMDALMVKLEKVDSKQHEVMRQRLAQLELIELDKKGKLEEALELAAKDTTTEMNQKNYLSVLVRFSNIKRENKNWDSALSMLDNAVQADWSKTMLNDLRFNTYVDWLDSFKEGDYAAQIDVYKKAFSDAKLDLAGENGQIMSHNYGNALYLKINNLIETRKFKEASAASKAALKEVPEHPELKKQGELIKRIMDRIGG